MVALLVLLLSLGGKTTLTVYPRSIMAGSAIRVTCHVPRNPKNRWVEWGVNLYQTSGRQINGVSAPMTYEAVFEKLPCYVGPAYCAVADNQGHTTLTTADLSIVGCDPN